MNSPGGKKLHRIWHAARKQATTGLVDTVRVNYTRWLVVGLIVAATGAAPEVWFARVLNSVHISSDALHLWAAHVDLRVAIVSVGVAIIVGDLLWRHYGQPKLTPKGGTAAAEAAVQPALEALLLPDKPWIAVLPFQNISGDPEQDYFADGIAEDIITMLSRSQSLFVIARTSSFTYKGRAVDVKQVSRELGVRYVLEGSVRRGGNRVRITAQLIDARTGNHLWAERYDRDLVDIFAVQDEITDAVATAIEPAVAEMERSARHSQTAGRTLALGKLTSVDFGILFASVQRRTTRRSAFSDARLSLIRTSRQLTPCSPTRSAMRASSTKRLAYLTPRTRLLRRHKEPSLSIHWMPPRTHQWEWRTFCGVITTVCWLKRSKHSLLTVATPTLTTFSARCCCFLAGREKRLNLFASPSGLTRSGSNVTKVWPTLPWLTIFCASTRLP